MKSVAADSVTQLRRLAADFPPLFAYVDNMNVFARVRDQRRDNRAEMLNYTVGYIGLNPHPAGQHMLLRENVQAKLDTLCADHLLPTESNLYIYAKHVLGWDLRGIVHILRFTFSPTRRRSMRVYDSFPAPSRAHRDIHSPGV